MLADYLSLMIRQQNKYGSEILRFKEKESDFVKSNLHTLTDALVSKQLNKQICQEDYQTGMRIMN